MNALPIVVIGVDWLFFAGAAVALTWNRSQPPYCWEVGAGASLYYFVAVLALGQ